MKPEEPIALQAYEKLAEPFSRLVEEKTENAYIEQPTIRSMLGDRCPPVQSFGGA
jgi:hypothetical protein